MRAIDFFEEAKRLFSDKMYDTLSGYFLTALNSAISKVVNDIKVHTHIYKKPVPKGKRFVEVGDRVLDVLYAFLEKNNRSYLLRKTTLSALDLDVTIRGRPSYYVFTNTSTPFSNAPLPCIIFDYETDEDYDLIYLCKEEPPEIKDFYDEILLPNWTKIAIKFYLFYMLCQFFRDPRVTLFLQLYEKEIEEKNDRYYEEIPVTGIKRRKIIFLTDNPSI